MKTTNLIIAALIVAFAVSAIPLTAVIARQQSGSASGVDSGGYPYSGHWWITSSGDTVTFATHTCGVTTMTSNLPQQYAACVLEECEQGYLEFVVGGGEDHAACTDSGCCESATRWAAGCLGSHGWGVCD